MNEGTRSMQLMRDWLGTGGRKKAMMGSLTKRSGTPGAHQRPRRLRDESSAEAKERRNRERGVALVALAAALTIGLILLMVILPSVNHVAKDEREKELLFRGMQIADAIGRFQGKFGAPPPSLEALVKQKCLRKEFKDPMDPEGEWRIIRLGQPITCAGSPKPKSARMPSFLPTARQPGLGPGGTGIGPIVGVASKSEEKSIRKFNNGDDYSKWIFAVNCPRDWTFAPPLAPGPYAPGAASGEPIHVLISPARGGPQPPRPNRPSTPKPSGR